MKRILFFLVLGGSFLAIYNLSTSIINLWQKRDLIVKEQNELEAQKKENLELLAKLKQAQDKDFVEKTARDKLLMVKEGENSLVIDEKLLKTLSASKSGELQKDKQSNPQKWWNLFFDSS